MGVVDEQSSAQHLIKVKCEIRGKKMMTSQLNLVMNFKMITGVVYLKAILKKIQLARDLLVLDVETGKEAMIPKLLSQDWLPQSFRYYDAVLKMV